MHDDDDDNNNNSNNNNQIIQSVVDYLNFFGGGVVRGKREKIPNFYIRIDSCNFENRLRAA
jgi:hypothetical protein